MTAPPGGSGRLARFPALDPEPPPRPWWRRALLPVTAALLVAAGAAAIVLALRPTPGGPAPASHGQAARPVFAAPGLILVALPGGVIGTADPDGAGVTQLPGLGDYSSGTAAALDNRYLTIGNGQLATIGSGAVLTYQPTTLGTSSQASSPLDPFADHDTRLVLLGEPGGTPTTRNSIWLAAFPGGRENRIGTGDAVAGDPASAGAFASVARRPGRQGTGPDSSVELLTAGRPAATLATAAGLNQVLGRNPGLPVILTPYPSPAGDRIAVTVNPVSGSATGGIVVLSRTGKVLADRPIPQGPVVGAVPAWSGSGRSLAYAAAGPQGSVLRIWTIGGASLTEAYPHPGDRYDTCMWSPDGRWVLCDAALSQTTDVWAVGHAAGGALVPVQAPGRAVTWLS